MIPLGRTRPKPKEMDPSPLLLRTPRGLIGILPVQVVVQAPEHDIPIDSQLSGHRSQIYGQIDSVVAGVSIQTARYFRVLCVVPRIDVFQNLSISQNALHSL